MPLQYTDIAAWKSIREQSLEQWEINAIISMDSAYMEIHCKPEPQDVS